MVVAKLAHEFVHHTRRVQLGCTLLFLVVVGLVGALKYDALTPQTDGDFLIRGAETVDTFDAVDQAKAALIAQQGDDSKSESGATQVQSVDATEFTTFLMYRHREGKNVLSDPAAVAAIAALEARFLQDPNYGKMCHKASIDGADAATLAARKCTPRTSAVATALGPDLDPLVAYPRVSTTSTAAEVDWLMKNYTQAAMVPLRAVFFDNKFSAANPVSPYLRSMFPMGMPLPDDGTGKPFEGDDDRVEEQRLAFDGLVEDFREYVRANPEQGPLEVFIFGFRILQYEFQTVANEDLTWIGGSIVFVLGYLLFHTGSTFIAVTSLLMILMSLPLGLVVYKGILGIGFFQSLHNLAIFVMLGVGADNVFVFVDAWNQAPAGISMEARVEYTWRRAAKATFVTSFTTMAAFMATATGDIMPISSFGSFAASMVVCNYLMDILLLPATIVAWERSVRGRERCCCSRRRSPSKAAGGEPAEGLEMTATKAEEGLVDKVPGDPDAGTDAVATSGGAGKDQSPTATDDGSSEGADTRAGEVKPDDRAAADEPGEVKTEEDAGAAAALTATETGTETEAGAEEAAEPAAAAATEAEAATEGGTEESSKGADAADSAASPAKDEAGVDSHAVTDEDDDVAVEAAAVLAAHEVAVAVPGTKAANAGNGGASALEMQGQLHLEEMRPMERFFDQHWSPAVTRLRLPILVVGFVLLVLALLSASQLKPLSQAEKWFPEGHPIDKAMFWSTDVFGLTERDKTVQVEVAWGVLGIDREGTDRYDPTDKGKPIFDSAFDMSAPAAQQWVLDTCNDPKAPAKVRSCFVSAYKTWLEGNGASFPFVAAAGQDQSTAFSASLASFAASSAGRDFAGGAQVLFDKTGRLAFAEISYVTTLALFEPYDITKPQYDAWQNWLTARNNDPAAPAGVRRAVQTAGISWQWMISERALVTNALNGMALSMLVAFVVLVVATDNAIVGSLAALCIVGIVSSVMGSISAMGWELGTTESISAVILVGFSVDYSVHLGVSYRESKAPTSAAKVHHALVEMGISIVGGGMTTLGSGLFLMGGTLIFFTKFAAVIILTVLFSLLWALAVFPALLLTLGPVGEKGSLSAAVAHLRARCGGKGKGKGKGGSDAEAPSIDDV